MNEADLLKERIRRALAGAALDGRLHQAWKNLDTETGEEASLAPHCQAKHLLCNVASSGKLAATLTEVKQQRQKDPAEVALQARNALGDAASSGRLAAAITKIRQQREKEDSAHVIRQARSTLFDAASSGKLKAAITKVWQVKEVEELRGQLRTALSNAAQSGRLEEVCQQVSRLERARNQAKDTLMQSPGSGGFAKTIEEVSQQTVADAPEIHEVTSAKEDQKSASNRKSSRPGSRMSSHTQHPSIPSAPHSTVIRLDLDEEADDTNADAARESSLVRGYNALGVEFHCMGDGEVLPPAAPPAFIAPRAPASRPGSRYGASRHRAALEMASAMAQDLGIEPPVLQQCSHRMQVEPKSATKGALGLKLGEGTACSIPWGSGSCLSAPKDHGCRMSLSVGAGTGPRKAEAVSSKGFTQLPPVLPATKAQRPILPKLPGSCSGPDTEAAAWKMHHARNEHRWGNSPAIF
mmetsp:Transcript_86140/g.171016  ORF Transcript_86140/g.171016 Transcript_86140/m.171016 type:complete len:467 (+) Transcript_86140:149-1549(+)